MGMSWLNHIVTLKLSDESEFDVGEPTVYYSSFNAAKDLAIHSAKN
nr:hypothetical protein Iba_chr14bCG15510 [Ipomoea batatas]